MKLVRLLFTVAAIVFSAVVWAKVNLNTASQSELESLKGIGAKKAERIIAYREKVGEFRSIEELVNVSGIGEATLNKIRDEIEVTTTHTASSVAKKDKSVEKDTNSKDKEDNKSESKEKEVKKTSKNDSKEPAKRERSSTDSGKK